MTASLPPATDDLTLSPASAIPREQAAAVVTAMAGAVGAHVGIWYRADDEGTRRHLHLAWHHRLMDEPDLEASALWVEPMLDEFEAADVSTSARLIASRHRDGLVPYGLRLAAGFNPDGALQLNGGLGLTCATFVMRVFEHASVPLLDEKTWDSRRSAERVREDEEAQSALVRHLRERPQSHRHALLVEQEVGCTRFRAEEVAAASGLSGRPAPFARVEPQGRKVLAAVRTRGAGASRVPQVDDPHG